MEFMIPPPLPDGTASYCQGCQSLAPTKYVVFYRHIGAIILMFNQHIKGRLCRSCVNEHFTKTTMVTSFLGWWGMISFILTPFILLNNIIRYLFCLSLKPADGSSSGTGLAFVTLLVAASVLGLLVFFVVSVARS